MSFESTLEVKKLGLPIWGWGIGVIGVLGFVVLKQKGSGNSTAKSTTAPVIGQPGGTTALDPTDAALLGNLSDQLRAIANNNSSPASTGTTPGGSGAAPGGTDGNGSGTGTQPYDFNAIQQQLQNAINAANKTASSWWANQPIASIQPAQTPPIVGSNNGHNAINPALQARQSLGDNAIVAYFAQFKLPSWIGLQYVAENFGLPANITDLNNWLDSHGYRDASSGTFTATVSTATVPANVQAEINQAYGT